LQLSVQRFFRRIKEFAVTLILTPTYACRRIGISASVAVIRNSSCIYISTPVDQLFKTLGLSIERPYPSFIMSVVSCNDVMVFVLWISSVDCETFEVVFIALEHLLPIFGSFGTPEPYGFTLINAVRSMQEALMDKLVVVCHRADGW
jgi:hypothetical protein